MTIPMSVYDGQKVHRHSCHIPDAFTYIPLGTVPFIPDYSRAIDLHPLDIVTMRPHLTCLPCSERGSYASQSCL